MTRNLRIWLLTALQAVLVLSCTSGSAQTDADIRVDARFVDALPGCAPDGFCGNGLSCCPVGDESFCVSTDRDRNNCGACGAQCDAVGSDRCQGGDCLCGDDSACPAGIECCGDDGCATTDDSCGTCGNQCAEGTTCSGGQCLCDGEACSEGQTCCGEGCADLSNDDDNCGTCGNQCGDGESCQAGECVCLSAGYVCAQGYTCCDGGCRDLEVDYDNCGVCLFQCNADTYCDTGSCDGVQQDTPLAPASAVLGIYSGPYHNCARLNDGTVRCWGNGSNSRTGLGHQRTIGDNEFPESASAVRIGEPLVDMALGTEHTCGRTAAGNIYCWGRSHYGQLGYGNQRDVGDDETPGTAGYVAIGPHTATQVVAGAEHTCVALANGGVRCWGRGLNGRLGTEDTVNIGDNESPTDMPQVNVGFAVAALTAGSRHTCALSPAGAVRCWGYGSTGRLGYGNNLTIGDNEAPAAAGNVDIGGTVVQLAAGGSHTCALLTNGAVRCWGQGSSGRLGYGNTVYIGDNESPASAGDVDVGGWVVQLAAGSSHTCALLADGNVRCWGSNASGQLGYGNTDSIGDNERPSAAGNVPLGGVATAISAGQNGTCALLTTGQVRCWGSGTHGEHGQGFTANIGRTDTPADFPPVRLF